MVNDDQKYLVLDYETRSEADLKKVGSFEYANHPSTQILCVSWRLGTRGQLAAQMGARGVARANIWSPAFNGCSPQNSIADLIYHLQDPSIIIVAHNAFFEQVITRFVLTKFKCASGYPDLYSIPHDRWMCTASMAAALALPRNLEGACLALRLPVQKDMDGRRLILKYCKPRKPTKNNPAKWHSSARDLRRIMQYCQTDVDAETMLFLVVPPLIPEERKLWLLDQKMNFKGFSVDRKMVKTVLGMIAEETKNLTKETTEITNGTPGSTTQRDGVLKWLHREGVFLPDLRAKTVADALSEGLVDGRSKRLLEIRQSIAKTSTKKYTAFEARSRTDGRVRDHQIYHTASTGRFGGAGVQPHNFPRGKIDDTVLAADVLLTGDLEFIRLIYGSPMDVFSSCLRSVIKASKGTRLFCADYAAIEARVLFWVAKHASGLKSFQQNRPVYEEMASIIFGVNLEKLIEAVKNEDSAAKSKRQVGKQAFLGCGYGMGWKKFLLTCKLFGIETDEVTAQKAVNAYRNLHYPVVTLWSNLERAAIEAVKYPGKKFKINYTTWWVAPLPNLPKYKFLWCELPSGRRLAFAEPKVKWELTPWEEKRPVLYHWGLNGLTRKWEQAGTYGGKLAENVVQAISRDLLASAMLRIDETPYELIMSVHDELVAERYKSDGNGSVEEFEELMAKLPYWAEGCPVTVKGWENERYHK